MHLPVFLWNDQVGKHVINGRCIARQRRCYCPRRLISGTRPPSANFATLDGDYGLSSLYAFPDLCAAQQRNTDIAAHFELVPTVLQIHPHAVNTAALGI
jgi:hypothetical protein